MQNFTNTFYDFNCKQKYSSIMDSSIKFVGNSELLLPPLVKFDDKMGTKNSRTLALTMS